MKQLPSKMQRIRALTRGFVVLVILGLIAAGAFFYISFVTLD